MSRAEKANRKDNETSRPEYKMHETSGRHLSVLT